MNANEDGSVTCYMDGTDWGCELGAAADGTKLHPRAVDCAKSMSRSKLPDYNMIHLRECGIAEVKVEFVRWALPPGCEDVEINAFFDSERAEGWLKKRTE